MDRMTKLSETIRTLMEGEFSGYIKINFTQGSLGRIEKSEEFEGTTIALPGRNNGRSGGNPVRQGTLKAVPLVFMLSLALAGCASSGSVKPALPGAASDPGNARTVRAGDVADLRYLCRLKSGEVVAATDEVPGELPKSNIFLKQKDEGPRAVTATGPEEPYTPEQEEPFEDEILGRLSGKVAGMKEGERRPAQITAQDVPAPDEQNYIVRLTRVRTRPKEMKFTPGEYRNRTHKEPEVGQAFIMDPSFPGTVEAVTEQEVVVRFSAKPGDVLKTPFGPGVVREEGPNYKVDIDAAKGGLTRIGSMIGRIADVDDKTITVDFRNSFGGETLFCDVTVEKIDDARLVLNESSER